MIHRATRNRRDVAAGLIFVLCGLAFAAIAYLDLPIGTATRMGPGYFPIVLGGLLAVIGVVVAVRAGAADELSEFGPIPWRGAFFTALALVFFALTLGRLGIVPTVFVTTVLGSLASTRITPLQVLVTAAVLTALCALIFGDWLGVPIPIFGPWARFW